MTETALPPVPDHVPAALVRDFDFFAIPGSQDDVQAAWRALQDEGPEIFWTPRNGGHWVVTRGEDVETMQLDHERFSHANYLIPKTERAVKPLPLGVDPPEHRKYRMLINPALSPKAVRGLEGTIRGITIELLDEIVPRGGCEFVADFAKVLPIVVFLGIVDLPAEDRDTLVPYAEGLIRGRTVEERQAALASLAQYLGGWIQRRREQPGDDLISKIATAQFGDRPIADHEAFGLTMLVLAGGLDTVAAMLGFSVGFLARNPEHRRQLLEDPELIPAAVEELIRRHGLVSTGREITRDFDYKGVPFRRGDMVQVPNVLYGLDDRIVPDPLTVDFRRERPAPHAAFGNGPHKCPGANLARQELRIFLEEWLARIPDFRIADGHTPEYDTGMVSGVTTLELAWDIPSA